ncbi:MAG: sulfite exporter TauE/SafE family protein [Candidatus Moranbacteria bacterium]|nr:sulfite exporter TauE/SafE family protein [Candidatus Moranbacteria bacterium]
MTLGLIAIGAITGFISAFFGIGGSSIDTPLLREFLHFPPYLALGTPLPTAFLTVTIALAAYWKMHLVNRKLFIYSIIGGTPGILAGSLSSGLFSGKTLMLLTAVVLFSVGISFITKSIHERKRSEYRKSGIDKNILRGGKIAAVSGLAGFLSGVLANGGGLFLIPAYVIFFKINIKEAIATSLSVVAVTILPSCLIHYSLGHIDLAGSAAMGIGVVPMAYIGAKMDIRTKSSVIQALFGAMLIIFSVYFFFSQI